MYKNVLEDSGLKSGEAEIYDLLLQYGDSPASELTSKTNLKRGMIYKFLDDLKKKALVSTYSKNKKTYFRAEHPHKLMQKIEGTLQDFQSQKIALEAILPELAEKYNQKQLRPTVVSYEGIRGIRKVFKDIYAPKDEPVYGCVDVESSEKAVSNEVVKDLIPLRIRNNVKAISFIGKSRLGEQIHAKDKESLRESILLDKRRYPIPAEIDVYEDKVALLSFEKGNFSGILIQNKDIATSLKTIFKLAFRKSEVWD
ncbi:MAG: helix-turn-helix domain-containing protein [Patescibacteria group bacterium]|jgi:sugar-specific transcriptional regulator TrmB